MWPWNTKKGRWLKFFVDPPIHSRLLQNAMLCPVAEEQLKKEEQRQRKRESHLRTRILSRMGWKLRRSPGHHRYADRWLKNPHCGKTDDSPEPVRDSGVDANSACLGVATSRSDFGLTKCQRLVGKQMLRHQIYMVQSPQRIDLTEFPEFNIFMEVWSFVIFLEDII